MIKSPKGFTLIELLVVISIMGIIIGLTLFGIGGSRESTRDAGRKKDLASIGSAIEIYRSDCNKYPIGNSDPVSVLGTSLVGDDSTASCLSTNTYMGQVPADPRDPASSYRYYSDGVTFEICAALEQGSGTVTCGGSSNCGESCNYKVTNP